MAAASYRSVLCAILSPIVVVKTQTLSTLFDWLTSSVSIMSVPDVVYFESHPRALFLPPEIFDRDASVHPCASKKKNKTKSIDPTIGL